MFSMHRNKSVNVHQFAMIPGADIPRSSFRMQSAHKTTFDGGYLVPCYVDEVLPGDSFSGRMTAFCRLATPIFPIMDNMVFESFFFFVPCRLVWANWKKFMGEQANPADSISFNVPITTSPAGGWPTASLGDYFGLPTSGAPVVGAIDHNSLPLRCYNLIYNEWYRDENLQNSVTMNTTDGPDSNAIFNLLRRGKRHDYFTSCLPWPQKGAVAVSLPLGTTAPVIPTSSHAAPTMWNRTAGTTAGTFQRPPAGGGTVNTANVGGANEQLGWDSTALMADLSAATAATINQIRQAFQIQKLLERDARGGTRYTEIVRSHFGVVSPDARLQRPEYIGGGSAPVNISEVPQTSASAGANPQGTLAATGRVLAHGHGFKYSATEHGYIIGLMNVRADLSYQQGLRKMWSRVTRYDFYFPVFSHLGEQAVLNKEICAIGSGSDTGVFGYQERWAEYRYHPSMITGWFRSTSVAPLDAWHLSQKFTAVPTLNTTFIQDTPPIDRIIAVNEDPGQQFLADLFFDVKAARPMPIYSVPGLIDHF